MAYFRFNTEEVFDIDSTEYDLLIDSVLDIKNVPGAIVEIGTRKGGSTKYMIDTLRANEDTNRQFFCIDPYGDIDYPVTLFYDKFDKLPVGVEFDEFILNSPESEKEQLKKQTFTKNYKFDNSMRNRVVPSLYYYAFNAGLNFQFFFLEDTEFFSRYSDGVPVYENQKKKLINEYALVFFDGPHTNEIVKREAEFFIPRSVPGTMFVFDDHWMYEHEKVIDPLLFSSGFEVVYKGHTKVSYRKVK